jgi:hypothetical protein
MKLSVLFSDPEDGEDGPFQVGSCSAWSLIGDWAKQAEAVLLSKLLDAGTLEDTAALATELHAKFEASPPQSVTKSTVAQFMDLVGVGAPTETVTIAGDD